MKRVYDLVILVLAIGAISAVGATPETQAQRLFKRLTGVPISLSDPRLAQMAALIEKGETKAAAAVATADDAFLRVTLQNFAAPLANQMFSPYDPMNDFTALYMGIARDDRDARELLTAKYLYPVPEATVREVGPVLKRYEVLAEAQPYAAGLLTTDAWTKSHLEGGTNRRAIKFAFQVFLCTPINQWREKDIPDGWVRRDVDRQPGGNPETYQNLCSTCHARMDALAGAFARLDYKQGLRYTGPNYVARKMNQNATVSPEYGNMVMNDDWEAIPSESFQSQFGFRTALSGKGPNQLGALIANSDRFKSCMAERVFEKTCRRKPTAEERNKEIADLAARFEASGYKLRDLFESTAILPACSGGEASGGKVTLSLANFREARESLALVTGVNPMVKEIDTYYKEALTRLPKDGKKEELNETSLLALTGLSALYCKEWVQAEKKVEPAARKVHSMVAFDQPVALSPEQQRALSTEYARLFWQRPPSEKELGIFLRTYDKLRADLGEKATWEAVLLPLCTSVAGSLQTWVR